jgi:hypothetical protein
MSLGDPATGNLAASGKVGTVLANLVGTCATPRALVLAVRHHVVRLPL